MCYTILSTCTHCAWTLRIRYKRCTHAQRHSLDPVACPNRMKRRRQSAPKGICGKCEVRKGSLSCGPKRDEDEEMEEEEAEVRGRDETEGKEVLVGDVEERALEQDEKDYQYENQEETHASDNRTRLALSKIPSI
ncbi:hypothetical protein FB567DRAFT_577140 [Paraphoma chrysanthemicola]|uniref:Uncharacterized protein n=1 Tax=Paraphoma chrysanthemicola TaxID=798071 RepID=A0A8K0RE86_9PLEO|nr:hypothetical protein FB567DRAFT_577140 [Paraphoma chrysanthemicola]